MRIVLDAPVLIRAHRRAKSRAKRLLDSLLEGGHRLVLSNELIAETVKVLRYPRFKQIYRLSDADLLEYTQYLQSLADLVILDPHYAVSVLRDPKDMHVLQTAECGAADVLCTNDGDFGEDPAVIAYCRSKGIDVYDESSLLARLLREPSKTQ